MTVAVQLVMLGSVKAAALRRFLYYPLLYYPLLYYPLLYYPLLYYPLLYYPRTQCPAAVEYCHYPHGWTDGDQGVVERRVEY